MDFSIRPATRSDLPALGRLGASLMRLHHEFDPKRFMAPPDRPEDGYAWFLGTQLDADDAVILVAHRDDVILGYVYAGDRAGTRGRSFASAVATSTTCWSIRKRVARAWRPS